MAITMFRAVRRDDFDRARVHVLRPGHRLPGNVPYLIDNLWEYARPAARPSRRAAVYASPTPELALAGASASPDSANKYVVCQVKLQGPARLFQLSVSDARYHRDLKQLQTLVHSELGQWGERGLDRKLALVALFLPGTGKLEMDEAAEGNPDLCAIVEKAKAAVTLWTDAPSPSDGEIIFELEPHSTYMLDPI